MKTVKISERTHELLCKLVADYLHNEMLDGKIDEWDELNCDALIALVELNIR